jgi:hypothetical protein
MRLSPQSSEVLAGLFKAISGVHEERKVWSLTLTALASRFDADSGAVFLYRRSRGRLYKVRSLAEGEEWDRETVLEFFHNRKPRLDETTIMAPVRAGRCVIGVLALGKRVAFEKGSGKEATEMLSAVGRWAGLRRELAQGQAECATAKAAFTGLAPKDLIYRVLHHLRRFIDYNHGATVIGRAGERAGQVLARQVAWSKGRSDLVGCDVDINWDQLPWDGGPVIPAPEAGMPGGWLGSLREAGSPEKESILIGPLALAGARLGLIEVSSSTRGFFAEGDTATVGRFLPYLAWCVRALLADQGGSDE